MIYILFIVLIVFIVHQNSRINSIEASLKGKIVTKTEAVREEVKEDTTTQLEVKVAEVEPKSETKKDVSGEEVSGRILGRLGIAAVIIGVAFFLRYAFANNWVGPAGRVAIGILLGIIILAIGQFLRKKYLQFSDLLMGGGLVVLYLSIFSAHTFYHLVDPMIAFFGMILVTAIGVAISIINATKTLSVLALIGGFCTPFLIGMTELSAWTTFTYITILNAGTLGVLSYKKWPTLVLVSLIGTHIYFGVWLFSSYNDSLLVPTLIFILVQFLILNASSLIRIIKEKATATQIDYAVLALTALSFALVTYYLLMPEYKHFVSIGSVLVSGFYAVIALIAYRENPKDRTINIFLPGLAVAFLTAAVPIEFSGQWIAAWWFVEAVVLYIVASTSSSRGFQIMGVIVYMLGLCDLFIYLLTYERPGDFMVFFNGHFIMLAMAIIVAYVIAGIYHRYGSTSPDIQKRGVAVFVVLANILTLYALTTQIIMYYEVQLSGDLVSISREQVMNLSNTSVSILWAIYAAFLTFIGFAKRYPAVRRMGLTLFIITAFKVVIDVWSLGEIYRIVSFIVFGIIALAASFVYVRYKDRLKDIV
jgi:uncharacterized membrane protein